MTEENYKQRQHFTDGVVSRKGNMLKGNRIDTITGTEYSREKCSGYDGSVGPIVRRYRKVGRNDPCPCRSGKEYKKCCGGLHNR